MKPVPFFRAFAAERRNMLCSEPVVAWAVERGKPVVSVEEQADLWSRLGTEAGADAVAARMGLSHISADEVSEGDAVLLACQDGSRVLGVSAGKFSVVATDGVVRVGRFKILRGWSLR